MSGPLTEEKLPGLPRSGEGQMSKEKSVPVLAVIGAARVVTSHWCVGPRHLLAAGDEAAEG